jgi:large subunit ribosomal protein L25
VAEIRLSAELRDKFGKGAARQLRRSGKIPAVLYGHKQESVHLALPEHDLFMALKTPNVLLNLDIAGKSQLALPKAVQKDPVRRTIEHVDLLLVKRGEKVTVEIPIATEGELAPGGNLLEHILNTLPLEAEATHLPEGVTISIEGLEAGHSILAKDITLPKGATLAIDEDAVVLQVVAAQVEAPAEEETEEGAEAPAEA